MPKKKVITTTEEVVDEAPKEYTDLHDKPMRQVVEETIEPEEEKPVQKVEPPKEEGETIEFDPAEFKKEVTAQAQKEIIERITGTKEKKSEDDELTSPWKKENRNPKDYDEIAEWAVQKKAVLDQRAQVAAVEKNKKDMETYQAQQGEQTKRINDYIDRELEELYEEKKIPRIKDKDDVNDPGIVARKALFQSMLDVNDQLRKDNKPAEYSIYKIFTKFYKSPSRQPAGADAPVSLGRSRASEGDTEQVKYADIHRKSWGELLRRG